MNRIANWKLCPCLILAGALALLYIGGCGTAYSGHNTALDSIDLEAMTTQMASGIVSDPRVQAEIAKNGPLRIVCEPVENRMTAEILPAGQAEMFVVHVRALLSGHAPEKFTWIMNRDDFYALRGKELGGVPLGPSPDAVNPQYALAAQFSTLTDETDQSRSSYYVCVYRLTDLDHRTLLWTGTYNVKKNAVKEFLD